MKCGICVRVSTGKQETDNELDQLQSFARSQGRIVVTVCGDQLTDKHSDCVQLQLTFQQASKRKFDVLLFSSLDRLSREGALETLQLLNGLTSYGIQWRSLTAQYLDSTGMFRDAVISILTVVAKQERVRLPSALWRGRNGRGERARCSAEGRTLMLMPAGFEQCAGEVGRPHFPTTRW